MREIAMPGTETMGGMGRRVLAALALALALFVPARAANAQSIFGDVTGPSGVPDDKVTVIDISLVQLFALGLATPTATQLDVANVFPILSPTGCGPMGNAICIDFANRGSTLSVGDVSILQLAALGQLIMPPRLNIFSVSPLVGGLSGGFPMTISGSGFDTSDIEVTFTFSEDGITPTATCAVPPGYDFMMSGPVDCMGSDPCAGAFQVTDVTPSQIQVMAPSGTCHDANGDMSSTTIATVSVRNVATDTTAVAVQGVLFADALFTLELVSGDGQAGFPNIVLGEPLVVRVLDIVGQPAPTFTSDRIVQFEVTSNQTASLNGEGESISADIAVNGLSQVSTTPFPPPMGGGDLTITATLLTLYGDPEPGVPAVTFTITMAAPGELVLRHAGGNNQVCAEGELCPHNATAAVPMDVELIDRYGTPYTGGSATYTFTDVTAGGNLTAAGLAGGAVCMSMLPCVNMAGTASVDVTAGTLTGAYSAFHQISVTAASAGQTILPVSGINFSLEVQRPLADQVVLANPAQAQRVADRTTNTGPFALDVQALDQFGRAIDGETVTFAIGAKPSGDTSTLMGGGTSQMVVTSGGGLASSALTIGGSGAAGDLTVTASIPASLPVTAGDTASFLFAIGATKVPPPPVNLSLVEIAAPINNNLTGFVDGTTVKQLLVRGSLGAVTREPADTITDYALELSNAATQAVLSSAPVTNGLPKGIDDIPVTNEFTGVSLDGVMHSHDTATSLAAVVEPAAALGVNLVMGTSSYSYVTGVALQFPVTPTTVVINAGGEESFTDPSGNGVLVGSGVPAGSGTINYSNGQWSILLGTPAAGTGAITGAYTHGTRSYSDGGTVLQFLPVKQGTLTFDAGGEETFTDNGSGSLTGSSGGIGFVNYDTGAWNIILSKAPSGTGVISASYISGTTGPFDYTMGSPLQMLPVVTGTVSINAGGEETFTDNGSGLLTGSNGGTGSINYLTGAWSITLNNRSGGTGPILASYSQAGASADLGRFLINLASGTYTPGTLVNLRVVDTGTGDKSLPVSFVLPGVSPGQTVRAYVSNRTSSEIQVFDVDPADPVNTLTPVDANVTSGIQGVNITGLGPNDVAFFDSDTSTAGTMDRALVVNAYSHDLSLVRIEEEIMVQSNDLTLFGAEPTRYVQSLASDFLLPRNANCNRGIGTNFNPDQVNDCHVAPGDRLIIDPTGPSPVTRVIEEVLLDGGSNPTVLKLSGPLTSAQVPVLGNVNFRVVSNYREIDADNNPATTSLGADDGISRIVLPKPDPNVTGPGGVRTPEQAQGIAIWRPMAGTLTGISARAYITERTYEGMYVLNLSEDVDGQWSFAFANTGVDTDINAVDDKFFPFLSHRVLVRGATAAPPSTSGPGQIVIVPGTAPLYKDAFALIVDESPLSGTIIAVALAPDPAAVTSNAFYDPAVRFPAQQSGTPGLSAPAICQGSFPSFVGCEIDMDFDPTTATRRASSLVSPVYFDCDGDGNADDIDATGGVDTLSVRSKAGSPDAGVTALTPRPTNMLGDWWSQQAESSTATNHAVAGATCALNTNPDTGYFYRTTPLSVPTFLSMVNDLNPYRIFLPRAVVGGRTDTALVTTRGHVEDTDADSLTEEFQPVYLMDYSTWRTPTLYNDGTLVSPTLNIPGDTPPAAYPIACVGDLPHKTAMMGGQGPRDADNYINYPRSPDMPVVISGAADLRGPDAALDTGDDLVQPGDILVTDFGGPMGSFVYRYVITGVTSSNSFTIRTDLCDTVPTDAALAHFRIMRSIKLVDFHSTAELQNFNNRDLPKGIPLTPVRTARTGAQTIKDFKDIAAFDDGSNYTAAVTFSQGTTADPLGTTHVGTFDLAACLSTTPTRTALVAALGGCLATQVLQSNEVAPGILHMESQRVMPGAGGHIFAADGSFGYLINPETAEILTLAHSQPSGPSQPQMDLYPSFELLGGASYRSVDTTPDNPTGQVRFVTTQNLADVSALQRVAITNPAAGTITILEESGLTPQPRYNDTDNISGFTSISFVMKRDANGNPVPLLDSLVMGDINNSFLGDLVGFVTPGADGNTTGVFLGVLDYTGRTAIDMDSSLPMLQGLDTGSHAIVSYDVDPFRNQLFALIFRSTTSWEIRAWDMTTLDEIDLTTEVQNDMSGPCATTGTNSRLNIPTASNANAFATALAVRDGVVLLGFTSGTGAASRIIAVDTDNLVTANFVAATTTCRLNGTHTSVKATVNTSASPTNVSGISIQGDAAYFVGDRGSGVYPLGMLDMTPVWANRGCGSATCVPRDVRNAPLSVTVPSLLAPPSGIELHGNTLFVSTARSTGGNSVEIYDVTPYDYGSMTPTTGTASNPIKFHGPQRMAVVPTSANVGNCAGRVAVNGNTLYVSDGRAVNVAGAAVCNLAGENLHLIDLASPAWSRSSPPNLTVTHMPFGLAADEVRDIVFEPTLP